MSIPEDEGADPQDKEQMGSNVEQRPSGKPQAAFLSYNVGWKGTQFLSLNLSQPAFELTDSVKWPFSKLPPTYT